MSLSDVRWGEDKKYGFITTTTGWLCPLRISHSRLGLWSEDDNVYAVFLLELGKDDEEPGLRGHYHKMHTQDDSRGNGWRIK